MRVRLRIKALQRGLLNIIASEVKFLNLKTLVNIAEGTLEPHVLALAFFANQLQLGPDLV